MATSSGNSSPQIQNSGSEGDQKKRKRMESNRESARRSRLRKQNHLDGLMAQAAELKKEKGQIMGRIDATTQHYVAVEGQNSVLRAQMLELSQRLHSLNEILNSINSSSSSAAADPWSCLFEAEEFQHVGFGESFLNRSGNALSSMGFNQHQMVASVEMYDY